MEEVKENNYFFTVTTHYKNDSLEGDPIEEINSLHGPIIQYSTLSPHERDMIVNVTKEYPYDYAVVMFGYIMPFVLVLTLITNTLVIMVLAQRHMRTPTNIVLFTMAIVDLMTLLSPSPWYIYIYTFNYHDRFLYPPSACYAHHVMTDVIPVFFHTSSIWLALLLAGQRYIYVCHPSLASTWCTVPRVRRAIIIILVVAFMHQLTRFFDNTFTSVYVQYDETYHLACRNEISDWVHKLDIPLYYITYYTFRILFVFIIPCVALITLNYLLFGALRRADNKRTELLRTKFKLIGGKKIPVGRQSSFNQDIRRQSTAEPISNNVPIKTISESETKINVKSSERRKNFSFSSFRIRRNLYSEITAKDRISDHLSKMSTPLNQTSESKLSSSTCEVQLSNIPDERGNIRRKILKEQISQDSNRSCPASSMQSKDTPVTERSKLIKEPRLEINKGGSEEDDTQCEKGEFICLECVDCEQNEASLECQRCTAHAADQQDHQVVSLCSSLMGGATNTTTNEDNSSFGVNQNAMFVAQDGAFEAIESASMRGDGVEDIEIDQENASDENKGHPKLATNEKLDEDVSIDSRLACTCTNFSKRHEQNRRRSSIKQKIGCMKCNSTNNFRATRVVPNNFNPACRTGRVGHLRGIASCSSSEPCIDCDSYVQSTNKENVNDLNGRKANATKKLLASQSYYSDEVDGDKKRSNNELDGDNSKVIETTATATTTTTTLFSANNDSVGSLLQVQNNKRRQEISQASTNIKHSSFASSVGGRRGSSNVPMFMANSMTNNSTTSVRTMDSNRTTLMLIVVVTVFLMVEVPVAIVTILHVVLNTFEAFENIEMPSLNYIKLFTNFFIMISYSVNFTIYCSMSKKFRETFRDLFSCGKRARQKRARWLLQQQQMQSHTHQPRLSQDQAVVLSGNPTFGLVNIQSESGTMNGMRYYRRESSQQQECEL